MKITITQDKIKEIILEVLQELQLSAQSGKENGTEALKRLPTAYVACEAGKGAAVLRFLREHKDLVSRYHLTVVLEKRDPEFERTVISEELCYAVAGREDASDTDVSVTFYPAFSRSALTEAGIGMDTLFSSGMIRKDFEEGRRSVILIEGLDPFTGKEPAAYRDLILSHVRSLAQMGVRFLKGGNLSAGDMEVKSAGPERQTVSRPAGLSGDTALTHVLRTGKLVTANDIRKLPKGSTIVLPDGAVLTPMAKDALRDMNSRVVRS